MNSLKYITLAIFLTIAGSCKKSTALDPAIEGTWELVASDGGWTAHEDFPPGNGNLYTFTGHNYVQTIAAGDTTYQYSGTFSIETGKACAGSTTTTLIRFDKVDVPATFTLLNDTLIIGAPHACIADAPDRTYTRIN